MRISQECVINSQGFLFNTVTGESFSLNSIGLDIVYRMKTDCSEQQLLETLLSEYETDEVTLRSDLSDFLLLLKRKGLLTNG